MIVHLFEDEKFVDNTIKHFETVSQNRNRYLVFSNKQNLVHVKTLDKIQILPNRWQNDTIELIFKNCDLLVVHYLTPIKTKIIKNKPQNVTVVWSVWGKDAYDYFDDFEMYEKDTKELVSKSFKSVFKRSIFYNIFHFLKYGVGVIRKERKALDGIDYLATVIPPEYDIIKREFGLNAHYIKFSYDSLTQLLTTNPQIALGDKILVGNSATPSNNHVDVFNKIRMTSKIVIAPLNYGDMKYAKRVEEKGLEIFGRNFLAINQFLSFSEYKELVFSCNTIIMYHRRQQALGNILLALYAGIRVFLNEKSPIFIHLEELGFSIYGLEKDFKVLGIELTDKEKMENRKRVIEFWGNKSILEGTRNIVNLLEATSNARF